MADIDIMARETSIPPPKQNLAVSPASSTSHTVVESSYYPTTTSSSPYTTRASTSSTYTTYTSYPTYTYSASSASSSGYYNPATNSNHDSASSSVSPAAGQAYTSSPSTQSGTAQASPSSASDVSSAYENNAASSSHTIRIAVISGGAVGALVFAAIIWFCCKRRIRRRRARAAEDDSVLPPPNIQSHSGRGRLDLIDSPQRSTERLMDERRQRVDRADLAQVVAMRQAGGVPALPPRPNAPWQRPPSQPHRQSTAWSTTDSDGDMLANDGSTLARTLSTASVGDGVSVISQDVLDHPGYTLGHSRTIRTQPSTSTWNGSSLPPLTMDRSASTRSPASALITPTSTWSPVSPFSASSAGERNPFLDSASGPAMPITAFPSPAYQPGPSTHAAPLRGQRALSLVMSEASYDSTERSFTPGDDRDLNVRGLGRGVTIIRHRDAGMSNDGASVERRGGQKTVHLPPTYNEVYGTM